MAFITQETELFERKKDNLDVQCGKCIYCWDSQGVSEIYSGRDALIRPFVTESPTAVRGELPRTGLLPHVAAKPMLIVM